LGYAGVTALSLATALALSGGILLLLLGTQILNWYWLVLLFVGSLAVSAYRLRKRILSGYEIAQEVDRRLEFKDALSTAYYFDEPSRRAASSPEFIEHQRQIAEQLAQSADIGRGLPFLRPRTLYINAALAVLACGMFGLRYGLQRSLDLRPPLVRIAFEGFLGSSRDIADAKKGKRPFDGEGNRDKGSATDPQDGKSEDLNTAADSQDALNTLDANNPDSGAPDSSKAKAGQQNKPGDDSPESADKEQSSPDGDAAGDSSLSSEDKSKKGKQPDGGKNSNQAGSDGDNSSLADKLRDAISNLLAKLKPQSKPNEGQQRSASQSPGAQPGQKQNQPQDGTKTANQEQADANSSGESQGEQQQGGSDQPAQGKSQGSSNERPNSPDGKSGIGNQDGDKSAREAAELAAMGKISEIIGKRAQNITGEVMVEVSSGKQQLKTQYSKTNATHVEAGGEINRDEIPLAYQQYVQQYFEEVRKLPASKAKLSPEKATPPGN
jgi:hypothetical protein